VGDLFFFLHSFHDGEKGERRRGRVDVRNRGESYFYSPTQINLNGAGRSDGDGLLWLTARAAVAFNLGDNVHSLDDLTEDDVLAIEPAGDNSGDEELRTVGVRSSVSHAQKTGLGVLLLEVLIRELLAVDGLSTGTVTAGEVTALKHEIGDDSVEGGTGITEAVLASAELTEVLGGLWDDIVVELEDDTAGWLVVDGDIKVGVGHFEFVLRMKRTV
jgi:hypothetical protein